MKGGNFSDMGLGDLGGMGGLGGLKGMKGMKNLEGMLNDLNIAKRDSLILDHGYKTFSYHE